MSDVPSFLSFLFFFLLTFGKVLAGTLLVTVLISLSVRFLLNLKANIERRKQGREDREWSLPNGSPSR